MLQLAQYFLSGGLKIHSGSYGQRGGKALQRPLNGRCRQGPVRNGHLQVRQVGQ